jgi:predicted MFS family arabinose efflux permease
MVMNQFVGPPLGGLLVAISLPLALTGSTIAYALAAVGLAVMVGSFRPTLEGPQASMVGQIREGMSYLLHHRVLRSLAIMVGVANLTSSAVFAVFVVFAVAPGPMGLDAFGFGVLMTGFAAGAILGTVTEPAAERWLGRSDILFLAVIATSLSMLLPALTAHPVAVFASMALAGVMTMWWNIITVSLRQRITPDRLLGRVNAGYRFFAWGAMPIGALLGGLVAEALGVIAVFVAAGLGGLTMLAFRTVLSDDAIDAAERPLSGGDGALPGEVGSD